MKKDKAQHDNTEKGLGSNCFCEQKARSEGDLENCSRSRLSLKSLSCWKPPGNGRCGQFVHCQGRHLSYSIIAS